MKAHECKCGCTFRQNINNRLILMTETLFVVSRKYEEEKRNKSKNKQMLSHKHTCPRYTVYRSPNENANE